MTEQHGTFADRLAHLISTIHPADRGPYSSREIAAGIQDQPGAMSHAYINKLVNGHQPRGGVGMLYIEALAGFFGVEVDYFFDDEVASRVDEQIDELIRRRDDDAPGSQNLAQRISALPQEHRNAVSAMIDHLSEYQQQPRDRRRRRKHGGTETP